MYFFLSKKKFIVSVIIAFISFIGDKNSENQKNGLAAAISDNLTHGMIGAFTWIGMHFTKNSNFNMFFALEVLLCGICSSLIDIDHFIAAKSIYLKDAVSLKSRPMLHCTTLALIIVISIFVLSYFLHFNWLCKFSWILTAAFLSHHIRDSKRRGFWLWPFGSTPPLHSPLYIIIQMLFPHFLSYAFSHFSVQENSKLKLETTEIV